ncbi:(2Fe-2S)-binding protein [Pseudonocardia acaciae]|uniref:(2Fe-2S)-binding protein n=1 Tax=Pseudonocardia acaciae TaxID=551276 RepID=UPI0004910208|nr:(2Fe-2S)-binding protein [Pseudonocardia acaciae]
MKITLSVNGEEHPLDVEPRRLLSDVLRHDLGFYGVHLGCEHGVCGACTVLLDGRSARSCLMLAAMAQGHRVTTVEGLGTPANPHPVQRAFGEEHGLQCGFCTPGFVLTVSELAGSSSELTDDELREELAGNVCRCTGYVNILRAARRAEHLLAEEAPHE